MIKKSSIDVVKHRNQNSEVQKKYQSGIAQNALIKVEGFGANDLQFALEAIKTPKNQIPIKNKISHEYQLDKPLVCNDEDAFVQIKENNKKVSKVVFEILHFLDKIKKIRNY